MRKHHRLKRILIPRCIVEGSFQFRRGWSLGNSEAAGIREFAEGEVFTESVGFRISLRF